MKRYLLYFCFLVSMLLNTSKIYSYNNIESRNSFVDTTFYSSTKKQDLKSLEGNYTLFIDGKTFEMAIKVRCNNPKASISFKGVKVASKFSFKKNIITISIDKDNTYMKLIGKIVNSAGAMQGIAYDNNGNKSNWTAAKLISESKSKIKSTKN